MYTDLKSSAFFSARRKPPRTGCLGAIVASRFTNSITMILDQTMGDEIDKLMVVAYVRTYMR